MKPIKAVGFDMDGTLLSTVVDYKGLYNSDRTVLERHGIPFSEVFGEDPEPRRLRAPIRQWLEAHGRGDEFEAIDREIDSVCLSYEIQYIDRAKSFPRSLECLECIRSKGLKVGVLTKGGRAYAEEALGRFGMLDILDALVARDYTVYDEAKPSPRATENFAKELGVEPDEIIYLGDTVSDYRSSSGAGATFIGVCSGAMSAEDWDSMSPGMFTVQYAGDIMDFIDDLI